ncbi:hypothetical protein [Tamlana fucoidanivorans]|nr:hypothetical protein [Tamlana fucoidanivorans]
MKAIKTLIEKQFSVDWEHIEELELDESKRVYSQNDYNEFSMLFI